MGEIVEPTVVKQLSIAPVAIDVQKVVLPTEEYLCDISILRTTADRKWSRFEVRTTQRTLDICPGTVGTVAFDALCGACAAMFETAQGASFLSALQAVVAGKPLEARSKVEVVEVTVVAPK